MPPFLFTRPALIKPVFSPRIHFTAAVPALKFFNAACCFNHNRKIMARACIEISRVLFYCVQQLPGLNISKFRLLHFITKKKSPETGQ
ncbi:hypothetical protein [Morganella phage Mecenats66]|nr:hypothetical protein [Morganella phage Mecenats66]